MAPGSLKECHIVVLNATRFRADYTPPNLKKWIESAGGHVAFKEKLTEQTTHVVIDEDTWSEQGSFVLEILRSERRASTEQKPRVIHIVSFDWLQECLDNRVKRGESAFKWKNLATDVLKKAARAFKQQGREEKQPGNVQGLVAQAFLDSTETFVDAGDKKRAEKRKRQEAEDRAEDMEEQRRQFGIHCKKMSVPEQAAVFRKGAKRARTEILSDNHHIYVDSTGFWYDVAITKVDFNHNANERYVLTLQIYESNTEPQSYAFNCSFAGTNALSRNDIIAAIGSNFPTALRAFKKVFKEKTRVNWDDRILEHDQRKADARTNTSKPEAAFKDMPFEYFPPRYGPVGVLPLAQMEAMPAAGKAAEFEEGFLPSPQADDRDMSSAMGLRKDPPGFNEFMASVTEAARCPPGNGLDDSIYDYPFPVPRGGEEDAIVVDDDDDDAEGADDQLMVDAGDGTVDFVAFEPMKLIPTAVADSAEQSEEQSYQEYPEGCEFDDAFYRTHPIGCPDFPNGTYQIPSQESKAAQSQAFAQTQLTGAVREELLPGEQTQMASGGMGNQGQTARPDDGHSELTTTVKDSHQKDARVGYSSPSQSRSSADAVDLE